MKSRAILGLGMLCIALAACHSASAPPPEPASTPLAETTPLQPPKPPRKPPVPPAPAADAAIPVEVAPSAPPSEEIAKVEPAPAPAPVRSPLKLKAENLIGLDQPSTVALLGQPSERKEAAPATIWRYTGRNCELEIYFYLDLKSRILRALHYEVKTHEAAEPVGNQCFADLLAQHEADPGSGSSPPN